MSKDFDTGLVLFGGKDCPACVQLKNKLKSVGSEYLYFDIWEDGEALAYMMSKGFRSIPQLFMNGERITDV